jgi:hypothetical protein
LSDIRLGWTKVVVESNLSAKVFLQRIFNLRKVNWGR